MMGSVSAKPILHKWPCRAARGQLCVLHLPCLKSWACLEPDEELQGMLHSPEAPLRCQHPPKLSVPSRGPASRYCHRHVSCALQPACLLSSRCTVHSHRACYTASPSQVGFPEPLLVLLDSRSAFSKSTAHHCGDSISEYLHCKSKCTSNTTSLCCRGLLSLNTPNQQSRPPPPLSSSLGLTSRREPSDAWGAFVQLVEQACHLAGRTNPESSIHQISRLHLTS